MNVKMGQSGPFWPDPILSHLKQIGLDWSIKKWIGSFNPVRELTGWPINFDFFFFRLRIEAQINFEYFFPIFNLRITI